MLQPYEYVVEVKFNNEDWVDTQYNNWNLKDEIPPAEEMIVENCSFDEFYEYLTHNTLSGFTSGVNFFKRKYIIFNPLFRLEPDIFYSKDIKSISIRRRNYKIPVTLEDIFKYCNAEKTIQYLKERGLNICPFKMEK